MWIKVLIFCSFLSSINCYKILGLFPHPGKSHFMAFKPLMEKMAKNGHEVTVISHFPNEKNQTRYRDLSLNTGKSLVNVLEMQFFQNGRFQMYKDHLLIDSMGKKACKTTFKSQTIRKFLDSSGQNFDLILTELFNTDCFLAIRNKIEAPIIGISSTFILPWYNSRFGIPSNPSYVKNVFMDYGKKLNFFERVENFVLSVYFNTWYSYKSREDFDLIPEYLGGNFGFENSGENMSLFLVNTHHTFHGGRPFPPNVVEIGGVHLGENEKLPANIEKFIEESPHGVIYFSLGSMIKGHTFPEEKRKEFLRAFARLPQRVLWKWENETMPGKPENVMIQKWMPQFDILCHPKVKAFISHGGLLGSTEAVHCGVPMVIMPQYGDQHANAKAAEANGAGVILYLNEATEESVYNALQTVLEPSFKEKTMELSARFRDRPMSPIDTAIYWIEYVIRHKGAPHLKTAAVDMPLYQYLLLDVIAFLLLVVVLVSFIAYKILSVTIRLFVSKRKVKQS